MSVQIQTCIDGWDIDAVEGSTWREALTAYAANCRRDAESYRETAGRLESEAERAERWAAEVDAEAGR
jgi:hypothetical protein